MNQQTKLEIFHYKINQLLFNIIFIYIIKYIFLY